MASQTASDLLGAIERIGPLIGEHALAAEADRRLSGAVHQAMYDAGLFAMLAPKAYGGLELHPADCLRVWEAVARIDAAAAWNLVMNQAIAACSAWLSPEGIAELYAVGIPTAAGAFHPPGKAVRVDGGWRITRQVPFASGCDLAQWLVLPVQEEGAEGTFGAFVRRESATILDTWHTLGMRGTGSADFTVADLHRDGKTPSSDRTSLCRQGILQRRRAVPRGRPKDARRCDEAVVFVAHPRLRTSAFHVRDTSVLERNRSRGHAARGVI
jgi:alkylation response protein AidB-like acyl-CoA dehydrogenase